jgi:stage II sporulation protein D
MHAVGGTTSRKEVLEIRVELASGRALVHLVAPLRLTPGGSPLRLLGRAENGVDGGRYRGALGLSLAGANLLAVGDVALEDHVLGVVGSEMPATWPADALAAQPVAARSYALRHRQPGAPFDVTRTRARRSTAV